MSRYYGGWAPYVPVAERRKQAAREMEKLRKKGHPVAPITIEGRKITSTFWGKAWCDNLESYHDYENRLPRGRTYVRNGSVVDLQIAPGSVTAMVSGSSIYKVSVSIEAMAKARWQNLCRDCVGGIDSLVELLQGRFSKGVMERLCRQDGGLFPRPSEIRFSCSCPDVASMCKHVAAVLYGVGARFDHQPELLFRLRAVNESELLAGVDAATPLTAQAPIPDKVLETDDIAALFGLDMADGPAASVPDGNPPALKQADPGAPARPKTPARKTAAKPPGTDRKPADKPPTPPVTTAPRAEDRSPSTVPTPEKPTGQRQRETAAPPATEVPIAQRLPTRKAGATRPPRATAARPAIELTPDGYVKWWK